MVSNHIPVNKLPYCKPVKNWLCERYGSDQAGLIWEKTVEQYNTYLPDQPPVSELQDFVSNMFMGAFVKLGKVFDLNRPFINR